MFKDLVCEIWDVDSGVALAAHVEIVFFEVGEFYEELE